MKRVLSYMTFCVMLVAVSIFAFSASAATCDSYNGSNISNQNYSRCSSPVKSYLSTDKNGKLMRFQAADSINGYLVEYYDSAYDFESKKIISRELPIFGAFYETSDNYFILSGQENPTESSVVEVFRITKYDKNWNKISSVGLSDCNTIIPFHSGSARMAVSGNSLIIRTSHKMYKSSDGKNHQANVLIVVDIPTMKITDSRTNVWNTSTGYVSHSFNQFVKTSSDITAFVDHGDAYPRSVVLFTQKGNGKLNCFDLLEIPGEIGDNTTGVTVGGFEISSTSYLVAMSNVELNSNYRTNTSRNIYIAAADKKADGTINESEVRLNKLTFNIEGGSTASTPQLVKINDNRFIVLWESDKKVCYCEIDSKGNKVGKINELDGNLSDCVPVLFNGKIVWYTWENSRTEFIEIDSSDISYNHNKIAENGHKYELTSLVANKASMTCSVCGAKTTMTVATKFTTLWNIPGTTSYSTVLPSVVSVGSTLNYWIQFSETVDNDEIEVLVSNPSVVSAPLHGEKGTIKIIGHGNSTVTFRLRYNPSVKKTFTIDNHQLVKMEGVSPTCTKTGLTEGRKCSLCDYVAVNQKSVAALGHDFSSEFTVDNAATCTENGQKSNHCTRCDATRNITSVPATGHTFEKWIDVKKATCTEKGKQTRRCSVCGDVQTQESNATGHSFSSEWTIDVKATCISLGSRSHHCVVCGEKKDITRIENSDHEFNNWSVYKKPTCTNDGIETRKCINCQIVETKPIMKLGHNEVADNELVPTCEQTGKTKGSHCITCGYIIEKQEVIPALGHEEVTDPAIAPSCTAPGKTEGSHCARCKMILVPQEIIPENGHTIVVDERVEPTCDKQGKTEGKHCAVCKLITVKTKSIPATGHTFIDTVTAKTCTTDGFTTHECTACGYAFRDSFTYATGHIEVTEKQIQETCTTDGLSVKNYCKECGKVFSKSKVIPATGHKDVVKTVAATASKNGTKTIKCEYCGRVSSKTTIYKIASVKLSQTSYVCDGKAKTPTVTITDSKGKKLKKNTDYKLTYDSGRKKPGTYYVTVKFIGNYSGTKTLKFKVTIDSIKGFKASAKSKSASLSWSKTPGASKYEIYYSTSKDGKYKKLATTSKNSYTAKKLKSGKVYYFKIRAVATTSSGSKTYSTFSSVKKVTIK